MNRHTAVFVGAAALALAACESGAKPGAVPDSGTKTSTKSARGITLPEPTFGDGPIARVNGVEIPRKAFDTYYNRFRISMHRYPVLYPIGGPEAVMARVTKRLVAEEIIRQQAKAIGLTPSEELVKARLDETQDRTKRDPDYAEYHRQLGTTPEIWRAEAEVDALREELVARALKDAVKVPEAAIKAEYEAKKEQYRHADQVRLGRIRLDITPGMTGDQIAQLRQHAQAVKAAITKGAKFEDAAREFSQGSSREHGGELGWLGRESLSPQVADAVWKLKPGKVSDVLEDDRGIYIFKAYAFRKPGFAPLDDVRDALFLDLKQRRQAEALTDTLVGWRESAKVEILVPELQAALTRTATVMPEIPDRDPTVEPGPKSAH